MDDTNKANEYLNANIFLRRRRRLMRLAKKNSAVIVAAAPPAVYSRDVEYPYRQDSDFHYLTGFPEASAIAVLTEDDYTLFCLPRDAGAELWTGARIGRQGAMRHYGADKAFSVKDFENRLGALLRGRKTIYFATTSPFATRLQETLKKVYSGRHGGIESFIDAATLTGRLRWRKSAEEIRLMRRAARISIDAHQRAMRVCAPGMHEYEIAAEIEYVFARADARTAYPSIVGSGRNACVLHYTQNGARMKDGDLLLIDAGAEYAYYAADITRTFPVNGRFSSAQRDVYEVVLEAQLAAIKKVTPAHTAHDAHAEAVRTLTAGLVRLGLLKGRVATLVKRGDYKRFYMHGTGHWLGMDVHDCQGLPETQSQEPLRAGVVLTIEPGLYIPAEADIPKVWRGMGIRIEDDVLVTRQGNTVLTDGLIKRPDAIEEWMAS